MAIAAVLVRNVDLTATYVLVTGAAFIYLGLCEGGPDGQTMGKRAAGIRVIDAAGGGPIGTGRALVRAIGRYVSFPPFMLGYLWMLWDRDHQTWHDKLADTVVIPATGARRREERGTGDATSSGEVTPRDDPAL
jgi:uncharacterized RDD family membrane protein YckC